MWDCISWFCSIIHVFVITWLDRDTFFMIVIVFDVVMLIWLNVWVNNNTLVAENGLGNSAEWRYGYKLSYKPFQHLYQWRREWVVQMFQNLLCSKSIGQRNESREAFDVARRWTPCYLARVEQGQTERLHRVEESTCTHQENGATCLRISGWFSKMEALPRRTNICLRPRIEEVLGSGYSLPW